MRFTGVGAAREIPLSERRLADKRRDPLVSLVPADGFAGGRRNSADTVCTIYIE